MSEKTAAVLNIGKALLAIPFSALAAVGCAVAGMSGDYSLAIFFAGLSALPAAGLAAYDPVRTQVEKLISLMSQKSEQLEVPIPHWWTGDTRSWQNVCAEIEGHLPAILERAAQLMRQDQRVKTAEVVQQIFIDALVAQHLTWVPVREDRRRLAEVLALPIWQKINQVLSPVIMQIQQEEAFKDIRTTALSTKEAADLLREILDTVKPRVLGEEAIAILRQQYCDALYINWKMLDFRGIMHVETNRPMGLPLTEVFVCPDVLVGVPEYETVERDEEHKSDSGKRRKSERDWEEEERTLDQDQRLMKEKSVALQREGLSVVLGKDRRLVFLGDPGAGKSTLLRYLLLLLAHEQDQFIQDFPQLADAVSMIPLYIPLAQYAGVWDFKAPGERSLADFLPKYLRQNYPQVSITFVQRQLEHGLVFLLLDGLDEIPDAWLRHEVVEQIKAFTHAYSGNYFMVTSRLVGYKEAPLPPDYQPYTLAPFSEEQIKQFAQKWCPAYEWWVKGIEDKQHLREAETKEAERLFQATQDNPGVKRLAVNPLLLTILALIQRQGVELPNHRIKLFDLCVTTLIDTWIKAKKQHLDFDEFEMFETLRSLAFWMHERSAIGVIKEEDLVERIVRQLLQQGIKEYEAKKVAHQFLSTVRGKTGILIARGEQRYGFLHQTFEEYFAARELVVRERLDNGEKRDDFIRRNLHNPRWREVILLAVGTIGILDKNRSKATEVVQEVILKADSPFEEWLHRDLLFAGLCLADDIRLNPVCEDAIIERIVYLYLTSPYNSLRQAFSDILRAWGGTRAGRKVTELVLSLFGKLEAIADENILTAASSFEEKLIKYHQDFIQEYQGEWVKLARLQMMMVLWKHQTQRVESIADYACTLLSESSLWQVEQVVVDALGQLGIREPTVLDTLLEAASESPRWQVRQAAINALGQLGVKEPVVLDSLLKALSDPDSDVRQAAISALGQLGVKEPVVLDSLLKAVSESPRWQVRQAAINALGQLGVKEPVVLDSLLKALSDPDSDVRQAAARVLGQLGVKEPVVLDSLLKALSDPDSGVRQAAARVLGQLGVKEPVVLDTLLEAASESPSKKIRQAAISTLEQLGVKEPVVLGSLLEAVSNSRWQVRQAAARVLGQLGVKEPVVLDTLLKALSDLDSDVRQAADNILGQIGAKDPRVNEYVSITLSAAPITILSPSIIAEYKRNLHRDFTVRQLRQLGLARTKEPVVLDTLLKALSDPDSNVRQAAANALGRLGVKEPAVLDTLLKALSDPDSGVQRAAVSALTSLPIDRIAIGKRIEEHLKAYTPLTSKLFAADATIDALLFALQQVASE
jgi:HEAT repeat protein/energy-coupling factor transporter ATP-binding protein EcfA2